MGQVLGISTGDISLPSLTSSFGGTITYILIAVLVFISIAIGIWIFMTNKKFKYKIILFENIGGQGYKVAYKDRARLIKIGDGGEEILYLRKLKSYRAAYGRKMNKNEYWFAVGQDGYWYNFLLGDLDAKMNMLDIEPIDRDMRYMHVAIRKNIQERYRKETFMQKYGTIMINGIFLIIMIIALWLLIDQIGVLISETATLMQAAEDATAPLVRALSQADTICAGGSGILPA